MYLQCTCLKQITEDSFEKQLVLILEQMWVVANLKLNPDTCSLRYAPHLVLDVYMVLARAVSNPILECVLKQSHVGP